MTKRELLKTLYWGQSQIADFLGCSRPQAKTILEKAKLKSEEKGIGSPYTNKVYNQIVLEAYGLEWKVLEESGVLDSEIKKEKHET